MSILLLYGEHGSDFELAASYFHDVLSYKVVKLHELSSDDF